MERGGDCEGVEHGTVPGGGDPCLWRSSRAINAWSWSVLPLADNEPLPPNWRGSIGRCCMTHEGCTTGSKSDDKSYVTGMEEAEGRSAMESGGGAIIVGC